MLDKNQLLLDLFQAYYNTRQHKRNTKSAINFEIDYEKKLLILCEDLINGTYVISPSICFVINDPVQREIFAADFRDKSIIGFTIISMKFLIVILSMTVIVVD